MLSDPHFISPTIHDQGSAFKFIKRTAVGKDLDYQTQTITALVAKAKKAHPDALIITGDITLNGEKKSAEDLSQRLAPLTKAGIKLLIMPGNQIFTMVGPVLLRVPISYAQIRSVPMIGKQSGTAVMHRPPAPTPVH
ncbi:metallophosphoesterase family protein [Lacticaseibacillus saniviri]|uniref:metallophosphoesterase family protein n=1 Tax=Lacticaseibacillus saniviri TaxID=931533 RepID=UPI0006D284A6|nr:metallophosphoesterase [Lacticaseibacillus saniviri]